MVRFDILKYLKVLWDPIGVFVARHGVIMSHWSSVGVIARSVELTGGVIGAQWSSVELNGAQWGPVRVSETQCGLSGGQ